MLPTVHKYAFDPSAVSPNNAVIDEIHDLSEDNNRIIVPQNGPFYTSGLIVGRQSGQNLILGQDYIPVYLYQAATMATGHEVMTAIAIINETLTADVLMLDYQVVGGEYSSEATAILEIVEGLDQVDLTVHWDDIRNKPVVFPPEDHKHDAHDLVGLSGLTEALVGIKEAIDINNGDMLADIREQLDRKLTISGRTKLLTVDADILLSSYTGAVELIFGRSINQDAFFSLDFEIISTLGTGKFTVTAKEKENGLETQHYASTGLGGVSIVMDVITRGNDTNHLYIRLTDPDGVWENAYIVVTRMTTSSENSDDYNEPWEWQINPILTDVTFRAPDTEINIVADEISTFKQATLDLTEIVDAHIHDADNPHQTTQEQVGTEVVEANVDEEIDDILETIRITLNRDVTF